MKLSRVLGVVSILALSISGWAATPPNVTISVDATTAPRKIFHATLKIPAGAGDLTLYYPKWIPGEHAPDGPVDDLAGLKFSAGGQTLNSTSFLRQLSKPDSQPVPPPPTRWP